MLRNLQQSAINAIIAICEVAAVGTPDAAAGPSDLSAARDRVYALVDAMPREAQDELLALMWTGGPKNHSSFDENLELAQKTEDDNHAFHIAEQTARLPAYLGEGMKRLDAPGQPRPPG